MYGFTCNYCGETFHGNDYVVHVAEHNDTTDPIVDARYVYRETVREARETMTDNVREMLPR